MRSLFGILTMVLVALLLMTHQALADRRAHIQIQLSDGAQEDRLPYTPPHLRGPRPFGHSPGFPVVVQPDSKALRLTVSGEAKKSEQASYEDALRAAQSKLLSRFEEIKPDLRWKGPTLKEIERFIRDRKTAGQKFEEPINETLYTTALELEVPSGTWQEMARQVRLEESFDRQRALAPWLLGVLALAAVVAGYYRLDDFTKGYFTLWLRIGALIAVFAAGAAILFVVV